MSQEELIRIFTDTEMTVTHLKKILEKNGIQSMTKGEFNSGYVAGYAGPVNKAMDLFIFAKDEEKAKPITEMFINDLKK